MNKRNTVLFTLALVVFGCGGGDDTLSTGYTLCGDSTCQPGQYCDDEFFSSCELGCLSQDNCLDSQVCDKLAGDAIGVCAETTGGSCPDGICSGDETPATCPADCGGGGNCNNVCEPADLDTCPQDCELDLRRVCKEACDEYDFFECGAFGNIQQCYSDCENASVDGLVDFLECADGVNCDNSCFQHID